MASRGESRSDVKAVVDHVSELVSKMTGVQLGSRQSSMVESRLRSRMLRLGLETVQEYAAYLEGHADQESMALLSLLTTHHTFFFREFAHFEFLLNQGLPKMIARARERGDKKIRIWSAAASRGQEVYSLAMFMRFHLAATAPDLDFEIWGTDVDPESIEMARNGVYRATELKQAPAMYVHDAWIRGKGNVAEFTKVKDHLKSRCRFEVVNLLSPGRFLEGKMFDIVFCRNVFIYFNPDQISLATKAIMRHLEPTGLLFLGVSETLNGLNLEVESSGPSVYQHKGARAAAAVPVARPAPERTYNVLSVDDSPVILALLKKILGNGSGFKVAATAANGREALDLMKSTKFDIVTLDLHMPELDGLGFLAADRDRSVPVVVVSAVNRDDMSIAQKALSLGAADYVEKPSLENVAQAGNEIRSKLKTVLRTKGAAPVAESTVKPSASPIAPAVIAKKSKVLIVDDSPTIRQMLQKILSQDPHLEVVAAAEKPSEVEDLIRKHKPDVITLDIHMPEMDGVTLLKKIYPKYKIPTVMISSISREEGPQVLQALEAGAIDYVQKPSMSHLHEQGLLIREKVKTAARARQPLTSAISKKTGPFEAGAMDSLILIGASTGGTEAIRAILQSFPAQIPPVLIVQHIPAGFSAAFAQRLDSILPFEVKEAVDGDEVRAGRVLIAPGGKQMSFVVRGDRRTVRVSDDEPVNRHKPSVDYLFRSVVKAKVPNVVATLLTGMGADGARSLKELRDAGARTIAQDEASCVVFGMPKEAIALGAAERVESLGMVAARIVDFASGAPSKKSRLAAG